MVIKTHPPRCSLVGLAVLFLVTIGCHGALRGIKDVRGDDHHRKLGTLTGMELIRTDTDVKVADLVNGAVIYLDTIAGTPKFNVHILSTGTDIGSVRITSNVPSFTSTTETTAPYALCGNKKTDYLPCERMGPGNYTITATPYSKSRFGSSAKAGTPLTISFALLPTKPIPPKPIPTSNQTAYFLPN
jgi:hypothetical protein